MKLVYDERHLTNGRSNTLQSTRVRAHRGNNNFPRGVSLLKVTSPGRSTTASEQTNNETSEFESARSGRYAPIVAQSISDPPASDYPNPSSRGTRENVRPSFTKLLKLRGTRETINYYTHDNFLLSILLTVTTRDDGGKRKYYVKRATAYQFNGFCPFAKGGDEYP